jgi:hypothetical protein
MNREGGRVSSFPEVRLEDKMVQTWEYLHDTDRVTEGNVPVSYLVQHSQQRARSNMFPNVRTFWNFKIY